METLLESIRAAIATDASDQTRAGGAQACRTILTALEAKPGEAMPATAPAGDSRTTQIAQMLGTLRGVPAEQLLDLAISRLRAALPAAADTPRVAPVKFHVVQLPKRKP